GSGSLLAMLLYGALALLNWCTVAWLLAQRLPGDAQLLQPLRALADSGAVGWLFSAGALPAVVLGSGQAAAVLAVWWLWRAAARRLIWV
ncbi:MAG: hypothetical protein KC425_14965, partial [Anaerolineales bacterium]|nr:hypothetical protein [Anaerolineales bacterium]